MFVNKRNQLYKPERKLYCIDIPDNGIARFCEGEMCEKVAKYTNAFGTYDRPGIFYIRGREKPVVGIEYRIGDDRIAYPDDLEPFDLYGAFYYEIEIDVESEFDLSLDVIRGIFRKIAMDTDAIRFSSDLTVMAEDGNLCVFFSGNENKVRILCECRLDEDRAKPVIEGNLDVMRKETLYQMAYFDAITGHYNWNHLVPFLEMPMDSGFQDYAFVHFDVKMFRVINEVYGHIAANRVLSNVVKAMNSADFVYSSARCHNDNFAMIIKDMPHDETLEKLEKFFDSISSLEEDPNYRIYYRCGVVPMQISVMLGNRVADAGKMAQALGTDPGKTNITFYTEQAHQDTLWSSSIKAYVDTAIENDEFVVFLQPKFDVNTKGVRGAEALIRWNYKKKDMLPPGRFIPFFEKDGSIGKVDDIVLDKVCAALAKWRSEGRPLYPISVNLSRSRLYDKTLTERLTSIVDKYGVSHELIDFELTESASYDNKERMINVLNDLRERGFGISMDDFGTGYSSLSLLTDMPLDTLKIDKSFADKLGTGNDSEKDIAVIKHIISLAKELKFVCLAEGAESKEQVDKLREFGCEIIQGFYFSRPVTIGEYEKNYLL